MSRIDDLRERHKMMVLNAEILDAIRNRKYSLRHRPDPVVGNRGADKGACKQVLDMWELRILRMSYKN